MKGLRIGLFTLGMLAGAMMAQTEQAPRLLVLAKRDMMLSIVDPVSLKVVAKVPAGGNPHEVVASPDGRTAWITNYGNGSLDTITEVDLTTATVARTLHLGPLWGPHGLAFAQGQVYFTAEREKLIGRLAQGTESAAPMAPVDWFLGTGQTGTHMLWVSRDGTQIVTVNVGSGSMDLFERGPCCRRRAPAGRRRKPEEPRPTTAARPCRTGIRPS